MTSACTSVCGLDGTMVASTSFAMPGCEIIALTWRFMTSLSCSCHLMGSGSGSSTSDRTRSSNSSCSSSLLLTCAYSDAGPVFSAWATRRMLTASSPSLSRMARAVSTMRS
jgi:hypothetical protein